jgi:PAS domain S-box-containing protein
MFGYFDKLPNIEKLTFAKRENESDASIRRLREYAQIVADKEEKLRRSEKILRSVIDVCPVGLVMINKRTIIWTNQIAASLLGYDSKDVGTIRTEELYASDFEYQRVGEYIYERHMDDQSTGHILTQLRTKGGKIIEVLLHIRFVNGDSDTIVCAVYDAKNIEWICNEMIYNRESLNGT